MRSIKLGVICFIIQIILCIVPWIIQEDIPSSIGSAILIIASVLSILMWYEAIRIAMEKSIKDGLTVSGFYLIPYVLFTISMSSIGNNINSIGLEIIPWFFFTLPFRIESAEHGTTMTGDPGGYFTGLEPLIIFVLIIIVNLIVYKGKSVLRKKQ
jgi:hypothetical protein